MDSVEDQANLNTRVQDLERQLAEAMSSVQHYRELIDSLPQIIVEADTMGRLTYANRKACELTGYTREELEGGLNAQQLVAPEDRAAVGNNIRKVLGGIALQGNEYTALRKDGSTFPVVVFSAQATGDGEGKGIMSVIMDITERKKRELEREAMLDSLKKAASEIRTLRGLIPICAKCKKIKNTEDQWVQLESYISSHTDADFTHGYCDSCGAEALKKLKDEIGQKH